MAGSWGLVVTHLNRDNGNNENNTWWIQVVSFCGFALKSWLPFVFMGKCFDTK